MDPRPYVVIVEDEAVQRELLADYLARQNFRVALTAYQSGKIDFVTLSSVIRRNYDGAASSTDRIGANLEAAIGDENLARI